MNTPRPSSKPRAIPVEDIDSADPLYETWHFLMCAFNALRQVRAEELNAAGFDYGQAGILHILTVHGGRQTISQIAQIAHLKKHSITGVVDRMEKKGLVTRNRDSRDGRRIWVELTPVGVQRYALSCSARQGIHRVMAALSEPERKQFRGYLQTLLRQALGEQRASQASASAAFPEHGSGVRP